MAKKVVKQKTIGWLGKIKLPPHLLHKTIAVTITLPDHLLLEAMILAHKEDMTFNAWCNAVLKEYIKEIEKEVKKK